MFYEELLQESNTEYYYSISVCAKNNESKKDESLLSFENTPMTIVYILLLVIWGALWGALSKKTIIEKGYEDEGGKFFAIGFFLGLIGFIFAYIKPDKNQKAAPNTSEASASQKPLSEQIKELKSLLDEGLISEEEYTAKKKQLLNIK